MQCPIDGTNLQMMERQGIEIDYCPQCRGVWLDRGELDKVIERSHTVFGGAQQPETARVADVPGAPPMPEYPQAASQVPPQPPGTPYAPPPQQPQPYSYPRDYDRDDDYRDRTDYPQARREYQDRYDRDDDREYGRKRKRRSFLDDIFDFD